MRQELRTWQQIWRSEAGSRLWLSALIAAMEDASRPELDRPKIGAETLAQLREQLTRPDPTSSLRH
jgi:hypothetical protein